MDFSLLDDEALMSLVVRSRTEALSELYDRYCRLVYSLALKTLGDQSTAEEVTQDVFFSVWKRAETYQRERGRVSTWLTSIARHRAIDALRKRNVRPEGHRLEWDDPLLEIVPEKSTIAPEEHAEQAMDWIRVQEAVAGLPGEQREALALAYFQGFTHTQIAETLGEPLGTVKTRIRLAMQKLREVLV